MVTAGGPTCVIKPSVSTLSWGGQQWARFLLLIGEKTGISPWQQPDMIHQPLIGGGLGGQASIVSAARDQIKKLDAWWRNGTTRFVDWATDRDVCIRQRRKLKNMVWLIKIAGGRHFFVLTKSETNVVWKQFRTAFIFETLSDDFVLVAFRPFHHEWFIIFPLQ